MVDIGVASSNRFFNELDEWNAVLNAVDAKEICETPDIEP